MMLEEQDFAMNAKDVSSLCAIQKFIVVAEIFHHDGCGLQVGVQHFECINVVEN